MTTPDDAIAADATPSNGTSRRGESTKPITVMLPDDTLKKLRIIAVVRESSVSELVAEATMGVVKRELKKALSKIVGE